MLRRVLLSVSLCAPLPALAQTYDNCGTTQVIKQAPQRIIALNQHSADTLLALGVGPALIGVAYIDDDDRAIEQGAYRGIPLISKRYPSAEVLYTQHADLARAAALHSGAKPLSVFYLDSEADGLDSVGKHAFVTALLSAAGARNTFAEVDLGRLSVNRETLLDSDPDVLLLADAVWSPASRKRYLLRHDPVLSQLRAVKQNRMLDVPFAHLVPTFASGRVALELAQRFKDLRE